jgi:hypothetical protein
MVSCTLRPVSKITNSASSCLICGSSALLPAVGREEVSCIACGVTWRVQATMVAVLEGLGYPEGAKFSDVKPDLSRRGIGISDHWRLAGRLASVFDYVNTFYHRFPKVDVTATPPELKGELEFIICSDVLEHIPPPAFDGLRGLREMLRPGGFAVITVPCQTGPTSTEYYPELKSWSIEDGTLSWIDGLGVLSRDPNPEFHGGEGQTLTFRLWSIDDLASQCLEAGFSHVAEPRVWPPFEEGEFSLSSAGFLIARA